MFTIGNPLNFPDLRDLSRGGVTLTISDAAYAGDRARRPCGGADREARRTGLRREYGLWPACANSYPQGAARAAAVEPGAVARRSGVGAPLSAPVVRLTLALKIATLARGYSGVRRELVDALVKLYNADVLPRIPSKGSVGASGDLAPLAHLSPCC
jgi:histidine ammonia-lyase